MSRLIVDTLDLPTQPNIYNRITPNLYGPHPVGHMGATGDWVFLGEFPAITSAQSVYDMPVGDYTRKVSITELLFVLRDFTCTSTSQNMYSYWSTNGGSSFVTSYRRCIYKRSTGGANLRAAAQGAGQQEVFAGQSTDAWAYLNGWIWFMKSGWDGDAMTMTKAISWAGNLGSPSFMIQHGLHTNNQGVPNYLRLQMSSGNMDGGQVFLYGRRQTAWLRGSQYLGGAHT